MKLKTGKRFRKVQLHRFDDAGMRRFYRWAEHSMYDRVRFRGRDTIGRGLIPASKAGRGRWRR